MVMKTILRRCVLAALSLLVRLGNDNSTSFATSGTYHMFRAKASAPDTTLEIKVKDRFGNVYTESMKRPKPFTIDNYKVQALL